MKKFPDLEINDFFKSDFALFTFDDSYILMGVSQLKGAVKNGLGKTSYIWMMVDADPTVLDGDSPEIAVNSGKIRIWRPLANNRQSAMTIADTIEDAVWALHLNIYEAMERRGVSPNWLSTDLYFNVLDSIIPKELTQTQIRRAARGNSTPIEITVAKIENELAEIIPRESSNIGRLVDKINLLLEEEISKPMMQVVQAQEKRRAELNRQKEEIKKQKRNKLKNHIDIDPLEEANMRKKEGEIKTQMDQLYDSIFIARQIVRHLCKHPLGKELINIRDQITRAQDMLELTRALEDMQGEESPRSIIVKFSRGDEELAALTREVSERRNTFTIAEERRRTRTDAAGILVQSTAAISDLCTRFGACTDYNSTASIRYGGLSGKIAESLGDMKDKLAEVAAGIQTGERIF